MSNFTKIKNYYQSFDEWSRLDTYPGQLELRIVLDLVQQHLPFNAQIFDLGGGAGRYTFELAQLGYQLHLADLSPDLIRIAHAKLEKIDNVHTIEVLNAIDLGKYPDESFENILLFGPLYHLTELALIEQCISEVARVLRPGGKILASFIPKPCGLQSILERSLSTPEQVNEKVLAEVYDQGVFNNLADYGFQEGKYLHSSELLAFFEKVAIKKIELRSIRSIGYKLEQKVLELEHERPGYFQSVMEMIHQAATIPAIVETCGHAIFIGQKMA